MTTTPSSSEPEAHGADDRQGGRRGRDGRLRRVWKRRASRLAVGVVAAAVALTAAAVALAQGIGTFRDVPDNHYARDSVEWAVQNNITYGCRDGTYFCPERTVNRAESVTFLHRYQNNVIRPLENRVRALESGSVQTQDPNAGFGNQPTPTTVPPRTFTTRGTQHHTRSFSLPAGLYEAVFTLEATKAAADHDQETAVSGAEPVILIQVEYRENSSSAWKTHAVNTLKLESGTLPAAGALFREAGPADVEIANVPGRLPTSGQIRVSAYMADDEITPPDADSDNDRTTRYDFSWGLILTEKRS
ncbi:MAG: S-layer homology domain-containing protein [Acidimicrobiaceae bacterium]|nr:S-layer homology domain-containing protein [Acidimicrobiaceae bacterium]MYF41672.1 S-layer homology domain-containing protein [Acidimicrobiaceae bacterium]